LGGHDKEEPSVRILPQCRLNFLSVINLVGALALAAAALGASPRALAHDIVGHPLAVEPSVTLPDSAGKPQPLLQVEGTVAVIHGDDFAQGKGTHQLVIHDASGHDTPVRFTGPPPEIGSRVSVTGTKASDGVLESSQTTSVAQAIPTTSATTGSQNAIFILVQFLDTPSVPFNQSDVQAVAVTNSNSVQNYFQEASYGKAQLNITVTPWVTAQMNTSTTCDYTSIGGAANSAASAAGYNVSNYTYKFYVMPYNGNCGWMGLAYVGSPYQSWSNGYNSLQVYTHELGHNFTLYHAGSTSCGTQVVGPGCGVSEYGDPFDTMGNIAAMHYNSAQKSKLGWLPSSSVITHSGGTVNYNLSPIESAGASTYAVKIAAASNRTYWIEYRQPLGFDVGVANYPNNGVQIRVASPFESSAGNDDTELLDMTPGSSGGFGDAALLAGQSYTDSTYGITISVPSVSATLATVQVSSAGLVATSTALTTSVNPAMAGSPVTFTATVAGKSPTGTVSFTVNGGGLCTASLASSAAQCTSSTLPTGTDGVVATYSGDSANMPSTSPTLSQTVSSTPRPPTPPDTTPPVVTITSPANGAMVNGMVTVAAKATDNVAVKSVTLSIDGAVVATTSSSSVSYKWNTRKLQSGMHTITANALDTSGNPAVPVSIQVKR
jgi:hypothetical protein